MSRWVEQQTTTIPTAGRWEQVQREKAMLPELEKDTNEFMKGSFYQKVFDPLLAGQYAMAGIGRKALGLPDGGVLEGIKHRATWIDTFQEKFPYTASPDWKYNFVQELGRVTPGVMADVILDPLWIIPPLKLAKMFGLGKAGMMVRNAKIVQPAKNLLGKGFVYRFGQPKEYAEVAEETLGKIGLRIEKAKEISKPIAEQTPEVQREIAKLLKGEKISDIKIQQLAHPAQKEFIKLGKEAVEEGLLNQQTFLQNFGKYLPRLYRSKEAPEGAIKFFGDKKPIRVDLARFKRRKDIPEDIRVALGEIKEAGYPTGKGLSQLGKAIERARFFRKVAENPNWSSVMKKEGWFRLPETKSLGILKNKYVPPAIYNDIQQFIRTLSKEDKIARVGIGVWKWFKVIANPATHSRNLMSNTVLADLGGLPFYRVDIYQRALWDLAKRGKWYKELKANSNILIETYAQRDIMDLLTVFERAKGENMFAKSQRMAGLIFRKGGGIYQAEEQWSKLALYIYHREKGLTPKLAAEVAEKWLFNYNKVPPFIDILRGRGSFYGMLGVFSAAYPFITFSYKAIPRIVETALMKTPRLTKWMKMIRGVEELSSEQENQREQEVLTAYMKEGMFMKVPFKDQHGRSQYLDLNFILPWGDIGEVGHTLMPSNPIYVLLADMTRNKSAYSGREIVPPGTPPDEAYKKMAEYALMQILPNLVPPGYSYQKLSEAILKKPDYQGRVRGLFSTFLDVSFGLKTRPVDIEEQQRWRMYEKRRDIEDVMARIRSLMMRRDISPSQKEAQRQKLLKELGKIHSR